MSTAAASGAASLRGLRVIETALPGVLVFEPPVFGDARGFFMETYHAGRYAAAGVREQFVQDNQSHSQRGTLRGLHYQLRFPQAKLCRVVQGEVLDVAVDVRRGSPTFGRSVAVNLSAENRRQIFIPQGFAHGFVVLSETAEFLYKCSEFYHQEDEHGVAWNDPDLAIPWGVESPLISPKDQALPRLRDARPDDLPLYVVGE